MVVLAIDPGTTHSAYVAMESTTYEILEKGKTDNETIRRMVETGYFDWIVIEGFQSYGMPVGKEVFETAYLIGRLMQTAEYMGNRADMVFRSDVKMHFCQTTKAKDANVRQALIDRYGKQGTKKNQGKTYGFSADMWSAPAIATYWIDTHGQQKCNKPVIVWRYNKKEV